MKGKTMKPYSYKWLVKIKSGYFMAGTHRFKTKKQAQEFVDKWLRTPGVGPKFYAELPIVEKAVT
jgi:hypothetical protein